LADGDGVLVFVAGHFASIALGFDRSTAWMLELPGWPSYASAVMALLRGLRAAPTNQVETIRAASQAVADRVLPAPVRDRIRGWRHVLVADHGFLQGLAWELLPWSDDTLLGEQCAVTSLSSLPLGLYLSARHETVMGAAAQLDLVATLAAKRDLIPSAQDRRQLREHELDPLTTPYPKTRRVLNDACTWSALATQPCQGNVLQLIAHGHDISAARPGAALLLTPDQSDTGVLDGARVELLRWPRLVILSACSTGRGFGRLGDETFQTTLAASFLRAGAHTVVQSRVDLRLREHVNLLGVLHQRLLAGKAPAAALRDARSTRRRQGAPWAERLTHAQVQVVGLGHFPLFAH
jgi:CHAT domain-containing protein